MIKIITDSAADIPAALQREYNITVLPYFYTFDDTNYLRDGIDLSHAQFFEALRNAPCMPKTTQITADRFEEAFLDNIGHTIVAVVMSSAASGSFNSARLAKDAVLEKHPDAQIHLVDSFSLTFIYGRVVVSAARLARDGAGLDAVLAELGNIRRSRAYFVTDTLEYLRKGGRINAATVMFSNVLDIKPVLNVNNGVVEGCGKIRGGKRICQKLLDFVVEKRGASLKNKDIAILHANAMDRAREMEELLAPHEPASVVFNEIGATIGCHIGEGLVAINFFEEI